MFLEDVGEAEKAVTDASGVFHGVDDDEFAVGRVDLFETALGTYVEGG